MRITSFFSFKGGVGRSALLINVAYKLAARGQIVCVIDMDLAAPGLSFSPLVEGYLDPRYEGRGIADVLEAYYETREPATGSFDLEPPGAYLCAFRSASGVEPVDAAAGRVFLLPSGSRNFRIAGGAREGVPTAFPPQEPPKDKPESPDRMLLRRFARELRRDLADWRIPEGRPGAGRGIDAVLIDTRTGFPELLDLSLGYLADRMVVVGGINDQNREGLKITLEALTVDNRIPVGDLPRQLSIVLSPIPATDGDEVYEALEKAHAVVGAARRPNRFGELEETPEVFYIHYSPRLASSDRPLAVDQPRSVYGKEVEVIAAHLFPSGAASIDPDALRDDVIHRSRRGLDASGIGALLAPEAARSIRADSGEMRAFTNPIATLPPWYWPLPPDQQTPEGRLRRLEALFPPTFPLPERREEVLNGLSRSVSVSDKEKLRIIESFGVLSDVQILDLIETFKRERARFLSFSAEYFWDITKQFFDHGRHWAKVLCGSEGEKRFLRAPLDGETLFPDMEPGPLYWALLAQAQTEEALANRAVDRLFTATEADWRAWYETARILSDAMNRHQAAADAYRKAIACAPAEAWPWNALGNLFQDHLSRYEESEAAYRQAIDLDPKYATPWNSLGDLLKNHLGRYEESEAAYRHAIDFDPKRASPWNGLGNLLQDHLGRYEESEAAYRRAIDLDPKFAYSWNGLGNLLVQHLGRYEESEAAYRRAIDLDPKFAFPRIGLGNLLLDCLGDGEGAAVVYRGGLEVAPDEPYLWWNSGCLAAVRDGVGAARDAWAKALDHFGKRTDSSALALGLFTGLCLGRDDPARAAEVEARAGRGDGYLRLEQVLAFRALAAGDEATATERARRALAATASHDHRLDGIGRCYDLAGWRPELRERLAAMARGFFALDEEPGRVLAGAPPPAFRLDRFRRFAFEGGAGLGDPRDRPLWLFKTPETPA